jgi:hypothetical protein
MLPQAPEFDAFCNRVPSDSSRPAALWVPACPTDLGPWAEGPRDGVICAEGAMKANWITPSKAGTHVWHGHRTPVPCQGQASPVWQKL